MKFRLKIFAKLENISFLRPYGGVDTVNMPYFFKMLCENCGAVTSEQCTFLNQKEYHNEKNIIIVLRDFTMADSGAYSPLMVFDVDGAQIHKYVFNGGWEVKPINLVNGGFVGVGGSPPIVKELNNRFVRI
ncbi:hypothetical protein A4A49_11265 [Nicotiana attenuata]|uniref:Uncharacterized protein n=1 Tax=Nicotiana attenuata TaxID=49451 RepID=A0A1J6JDW2_NICAT|nr:hypothetical protein A4A49_11265 [Nicotiana attenuata]